MALAVHGFGAEGHTRYSQFFRNGYFETVQVLELRYPEFGENKRTSLGGHIYEENFINLLKNMRDEYTHLGVGTEMTCMVSIIGADKVDLVKRSHHYNLEPHQGIFDRKTLVLPDILLHSDLSEVQALKPVFDLVWQSAGLQRCLNYSEAGEWSCSWP